MMHFTAYFFGGVFSANAVPHFVSGAMGRPFQSPFAKPPGKGLSSSTVNVLWGFFNLLLAWLLLGRVGVFEWRALHCVLPFGLGMLAMALLTARMLGRVNGGNALRVDAP